MNKLVIVALGNQNAGKSTTWHTLFKRKVKTGKKERPLDLSKTERASVFLINGSPEETKISVSERLRDQNPNIVLCSIQYIEDAKKTIDYFIDHEYQFFVHWLNPGFHDENGVEDIFGFESYILRDGESQFFIKNGRENLERRVAEMNEFLYSWAKKQKLLYPSKNA